MLSTFDAELSHSGKVSIGWGIFSGVIGLALLSAGRWGWVSIGFGVLLIATGIYEMRVREPKVIRVSAAVLGLVALWNIGGQVLAVIFHARAFGNVLWAGIAQAYGAQNTWKQYGAYVKLRESADPTTIAYIKPYLDEVRNSSESVVEFRVKPFLKDEQVWRIRFVDDLAFMVHTTPGVFGSKGAIKDAAWIPKSQLRVQEEGERWIGSKSNATVFVDQAKIEKAIFSRDMLQRMQAQA